MSDTPPPLTNVADRFKVLELSTPPTFDGIPRNLVAAPVGYFCPCCPIEKARAMIQITETVTAVGAEVVFKCPDCGAFLVTRRERWNQFRKAWL